VLPLHVLWNLEAAEALDLHCGEPVHTASVPHTTWSEPRSLTSVPIMAAQRRGSATVLWAKSCPRSPYTLVTP